MQTAAKSLTAESSWEESVSAWMDGEGSEDFFPRCRTRMGARLGIHII
ncbi:sigma-E factor negative regulatory protein [Bordetella pertussis]|nr:sigma-E factor negative regulatory protein [Bordetella pertussis]